MAQTQSGRTETVSDTAWFVAGLRALESERPDALFTDPFARRLSGEKGIASIDAAGGAAFGWFVSVRTVLIDEKVLRAASTADTIVNLACGLDARAFRLDLPKKLRWFDVD